MKINLHRNSLRIPQYPATMARERFPILDYLYRTFLPTFEVNLKLLILLQTFFGETEISMLKFMKLLDQQEKPVQL